MDGQMPQTFSHQVVWRYALSVIVFFGLAKILVWMFVKGSLSTTFHCSCLFLGNFTCTCIRISSDWERAVCERFCEVDQGWPCIEISATVAHVLVEYPGELTIWKWSFSWTGSVTDSNVPSSFWSHCNIISVDELVRRKTVMQMQIN